MKLPSPALIAAPAALLAALASAALPPAAGAQEAADLRTAIAGARLSWSRWPDFSRHVDDIARLYASRADAPVWLTGSGLSHQGREAMAQLAGAAEHGLAPSDYDAPVLDSLVQHLGRAPDSDRLAQQFDLLLSVGFIRYLADLRDGRAPHQPLGRRFAPAPVDLAAAVSSAIAGDSVARLVTAVAPGLMQYRNLRAALARYRTLADDSGLGAVPTVPVVRPGDAYAGAAALARKLAALGDLSATAPLPGESRYAGELVEAVRRFQTRHGLKADGVIGQATFAALNTPLALRVRQLELALERLRWLPPVRGQRAIVVNIPSFRLFAFDSVGAAGGPALQMRVIVGRALNTRTPVLAEQLRYLEFQPYWNVPRSILLGEILPQLRRRAGYLRAQGMELVGPKDRVLGDSLGPAVLQRLLDGELRVRQRPGPRNPLGRVKFVFPNAADVYLHGTPDTTLFERERRDFSHGCIRVERPDELAAWALGDHPGWPRDSVMAALAATPTRRALLTRPIPVILLYATAVAIPGVGVAFYDDLYGHDRRLDEVLRAGRTTP